MSKYDIIIFKHSFLIFEYFSTQICLYCKNKCLDIEHFFMVESQCGIYPYLINLCVSHKNLAYILYDYSTA